MVYERIPDIRIFLDASFQDYRSPTAFMRLLLGWCLIWQSALLNAQLFPCKSSTSDQFYSIDNNADISGYDLEGKSQTWLFGNLISPYSRQMKLENTQSHRYSYLFPGSSQYWNDIRGDFFLDESGAIMGELLPVKGAGQPYYRDYLTRLYGCITTPKANYTISSVVELPNSGEEAYAKRAFINSTIEISSSSSGTLHLPGSSFKVDRWDIHKNHEVQYQENSRAGWIPTKNLIIDPTISEYFNSSFEYWFVKSDSKVLVAKVIEMGNRKMVLYRSSETNGIDSKVNDKKQQFYLYPSTSYGDIRLDFLKFESGEYLFEVVNVIGKKIWNTTFMINGDASYNIDLSFLPKGPYVYALYDSRHNALLTRRLAIIKP